LKTPIFQGWIETQVTFSVCDSFLILDFEFVIKKRENNSRPGSARASQLEPERERKRERESERDETQEKRERATMSNHADAQQEPTQANQMKLEGRHT